MKNIYLVGFMGTGKTAIGKVLASRLKLGFIDLDDLIEESQALKIVDIFAKKGEPYFRDLESRVLKGVSKKEGFVVACGGGIVLKEDNIKVMQNSGIIICLRASWQVIYERTRKFSHRPLLDARDVPGKIRELLDKREPFYTKVKNHVDTSDLTINEVAEKIIKEILAAHREPRSENLEE